MPAGILFGHVIDRLCADGILTVADDLMKNGGRKFIEMMELLTERRLARETDGKFVRRRVFLQPLNY